MKRLFSFIVSLAASILLGRLLRFILYPGYLPGFMERNKAVRCDGGEPEKYDMWMWIA